MTVEQRALALVIANDVRSRRAADKRAVAAGTLSAAHLVLAPPPHWASASTLELLRAIPLIGRVRAGAWCHAAGLNASRQLGLLTDRQRIVLADRIGRWVEPPG